MLGAFLVRVRPEPKGRRQTILTTARSARPEFLSGGIYLVEVMIEIHEWIAGDCSRSLQALNLIRWDGNRYEPLPVPRALCYVLSSKESGNDVQSSSPYYSLMDLFPSRLIIRRVSLKKTERSKVFASFV